jgi:uncharacterized protein (DUF488 family)
MSGERALVTVGHGTLDADVFAQLLVDAGVTHLVDVRAHPGSRRHPQFSRSSMEEWVPAAGVHYRWAPDLGGRRRAAASSRHVALTNTAFRAYADYMETDAFRSALDELLAGARTERSAVMCAETLWWRCHRRLIADAVVLRRSFGVEHLFHDGKVVEHAPTPVARLHDDALVYDGGAESLDLDGA